MLILVILSTGENFGHKVGIFFEINDKIARGALTKSTTYDVNYLCFTVLD